MKEKRIKIFTDGGVFEKNRYCVSVGQMFIDKKRIMEYKTVNQYKDSNYAEIFALKKILSRAFGYIKQQNQSKIKYAIEIYTDSLVSLQLISEYIQTGKINYINKKLVEEIVDLINRLDIDIFMYHIKSHIGTKHLKKLHVEFCEFNNCEISMNDFIFVYQQNKNCDKIVKHTYKQFKQKLIADKR